MSETPQPSQEPQITPQIRARTAINIYQKLFRGERVAPAVMSKLLTTFPALLKK